ncbi:hypothetical protein SH668x_001221 [Planctomicrobium sp. SH668]|uniref:hypothetical protein n=1 Tax=Planctomicrobium sp. SH668 TaxID=3448126 RepID=UPI003F5B3555
MFGSCDGKRRQKSAQANPFDETRYTNGVVPRTSSAMDIVRATGAVATGHRHAVRDRLETGHPRISVRGFFEYTLLSDQRFTPKASRFLEMSLNDLQQNREALSRQRQQAFREAQTPAPVTWQSNAAVRQASLVLTWKSNSLSKQRNQP